MNGLLTIFGACVVTFMMVMYALENRGRRFVLAFAVGCALSSSYGFLAGTWPFGIVEAIWSAVALKRYLDHGPRDGSSSPETAESTAVDGGKSSSSRVASALVPKFEERKSSP